MVEKQHAGYTTVGWWKNPIHDGTNYCCNTYCRKKKNKLPFLSGLKWITIELGQFISPTLLNNASQSYSVCQFGKQYL